jgi:hypothetical protein
MLTQTKIKTQAKPDSYYEGEFDAAIALPPTSHQGDYWRGYLAKVVQTSNTPF